MRFGCCANSEDGTVLSQSGYDYIELSVSRHLQPELGPAGWSDLRRMIESQPLPVEAFNTFLPADLKITGPMVNAERIDRYLRAAFDRASELGGRLVVFGSGGARSIPLDFPRQTAWEQLLEFVRRAGDEADRVGMTVCIEPLNRGESNVLNDVQEGVVLAREADHTRVRVLADLYHLMLEAEPMAHLVQADTWISHVHVADTERHAPGQGTYPYQAFFSTLREIDYDKRCSVECHWDDLRTECGPALEYLQKMWAESST